MREKDQEEDVERETTRWKEKEGRGKEKVNHIALSKLRGSTFPLQMQTNKQTNTKTTPHIYRHEHTDLHTACLFPLSPLL